jgi:hypothetical protein
LDPTRLAALKTALTGRDLATLILYAELEPALAAVLDQNVRLQARKRYPQPALRRCVTLAERFRLNQIYCPQ